MTKVNSSPMTTTDYVLGIGGAVKRPTPEDLVIIFEEILDQLRAKINLYGMTELRRGCVKGDTGPTALDLVLLPEVLLRTRVKLVYYYEGQTHWYLTENGEWFVFWQGKSIEESSGHIIENWELLELFQKKPSVPAFLLYELDRMLLNISTMMADRAKMLDYDYLWLSGVRGRLDATVN